MDKIKHSIDIDLARKTNVINRIEIKKNDSKSHEFAINLYNNSVAFNLLNLTAKIYFKKQDANQVFQDLTITDPNGKLSCILETQTLSYPGTVDAEVTVYGISEEVVTTITFSFTVVDILRDDSAIESTSEFTALTTALAQVTDFTNVKNELNAAKHDNVTNITYDSVPDRLDAVSSSLSEKAKQIDLDNIYNTSKKKQYVIVDLTNSSIPNIKIQYKYSFTEDRWIELERCGLNNLFSFSKLHKNTNNIDKIYPSGSFNSVSLVQQFDTDIIGPIQMRADANGDGDKPSTTQFTGGWHGYNGDQTGSATARHISINSVFVDGKQLDSSKIFKGYCENLVLKTTSNIQGYNTIKEDGSGREILTQEITWLFKEGRCEVHIRLITLESVTFVQYYGLQSSFKSPFNGTTIHYVYGDSNTRKDATTSSNSGLFSSYPSDRMMIKNTSGDQIILWVDNTYGLGTRSHISASKPSAFVASNKSYFYLISEAPFSLGSGQALEVHGGFAWVKGYTTSGADAYTKILKNGVVWNVVDFLGAGTETEAPENDEIFLSTDSVEELKKDANITNVTNYFYTRSITSNGYGSYWFRFKK